MQETSSRNQIHKIPLGYRAQNNKTHRSRRDGGKEGLTGVEVFISTS
ncbi:rCG61412 [Rattus norvegicus]|uniref:RCG61412 n=1 Tax=Rattus norvegicus TaxID=10116 RepID=A6H9T1_RAT|nr:rCG61412 [Rattus norvegicus]